MEPSAPLSFLHPLHRLSLLDSSSLTHPSYARTRCVSFTCRYAFGALAMNEFDGLQLTCTTDQLRVVSDATGATLTICPIPDGNAHLASLNLQDWLTVPLCQLFLVIEMVAFTVLAYAGLVFTSQRAMRKAQPRAEALSESDMSAPIEKGVQATPV